MKKAKIIGVMAVLFVCATASVAAQKATIDMKYKVGTDDASNYVNWSADGTTVKDGFDAASGASKSNTTKKFDVVRFDATGKKQAVPGGLRALVLFPVATSAVAKGDNLTVTSEGKKVTITFIHRGTAYVITSDDKGNIDMATSFKKAAGLADNVGGKFTLKSDFIAEGADNTNMASLDWGKVTLAADTADADAGYTYTGSLKAEYKDGVLTLKGNLKKVVAKK
jgi:hypothetical protein